MHEGGDSEDRREGDVLHRPADACLCQDSHDTAEGAGETARRVLTAMQETLTADGERCYVLPPLAGWNFFRATLQGTGSVTGSAGAFVYRYDKLGSP